MMRDANLPMVPKNFTVSITIIIIVILIDVVFFIMMKLRKFWKKLFQFVDIGEKNNTVIRTKIVFISIQLREMANN
jgi:hypothetical protein